MKLSPLFLGLAVTSVAVGTAGAVGTTGAVGTEDAGGQTAESVTIFAGARAVGTATVFSNGAAINAHMIQDFTISPLYMLISSKPPYPIAGDRVTIAVSISNSGNVAVERLLPRLEITGGSIFISALMGPSPSGPARIGPGAVEVFAWTGTVLKTGPIRLRAVANGFLSAQNAPISGHAAYDLTSQTIAQLSAELTPNPLEVTSGKWFTLTITVSNTGGVPAAGILPDLQPTAGHDLVTFKEGPVPGKPVDLRPGNSQDFKFTFSANGSGTVSFSTTVSGRADLNPPGLLKRASSGMTEKTGAALQGAADTASTWARKAWYWINPPPPPLPAERFFLGFEDSRDLLWDTGGYVELAVSPEHATEGRSSCRAVFLVPESLSVSASEAFRPAFRRVTPAHGKLPPLEPRDWRPFASFRADCYNTAKDILEMHVTLIDIRGFEFQTMRKLPSASATTIEISMEDARQARINLGDVSELRISIDTTDLKEKPVVFFDNFRFVLPPPSISTTVSSSSTVIQTTNKP